MNFLMKKNPPLNFIDPPFSAGKQALLSKGFIRQSQAKDIFTTEEYRRKFLAALHAVEVPEGSLVKCVVLLPYEWAEQKAHIVKSALSGEHTITDNSGQLSFMVDVNVAAQGTSAAINHAIDWNGKLVKPEILKHSLWLDIGENTTDGIEIIDGQPSNRSFSIERLGVYDVIEKLRDGLSGHKHGSIDCALYQLHEALEQGELRLDGKEIFTFKKGKDTLLADLANKIADQTQSALGDSLKSIDDRILTGGGGLLVHPFISEYLPRCVLSPDPVFDNVHGALKQLMFLGKHKPGMVLVAIDLGFGIVKVSRIMKTDHILDTSFISVTGEYIKRKRITWE